MNPVHRVGIVGAIVAALCLGALPADAQEPLSAVEIKCQQTIGKEAARYAKLRHKALRACADARATGRPCDGARRDRQIAGAEARLAQKLGTRCGAPITLERLGFPGVCPDPGGPPFSADDLLACVRDSHAARVDDAIATEYPTSPGALGAEAQSCQKRIGVAGEKFIAAKLKYRQRCRELQLRSKLAPSVNCRAEVPPNGPGTGNAGTDARLGKAIVKVRDQIGAKCSSVALEELGFPGSCPDPDGAPFSAANLQDCIESVDELDADEMLDLQYPPAPSGATPTATRTPAPTGGGPTATPGGGGLTATRTPTPVSTTCVLPNPLPEVLSYIAKPGLDLDIGWTGISHDGFGTDDSTIATVRASNCDTDLQSPTCGQCDIDGPIVFTGPSKNCRCFDLADRDASSLTECDPEMPSTCGAPGETCECFYGPPLPIAAGGVPVCVTRRFTEPITGTANVADSGPAAGTGIASIRLEAATHNSIRLDAPCPLCENDPVDDDGNRGGTCNGGPRNGQPCDVAANHVLFGKVSFDCPPAAAANIGNLDIKFHQTTGQSQLTAGIPCTAFGTAGLLCHCDTCATAGGEPCTSDADCSGGAQCGGLRCIGGASSGTPCADDSECSGGSCGRPGEATRPNACSNGVCVPDASNPANPNDGRCQNGPSDGVCSIETFRGCAATADCNPPPSGNCTTCDPGQTCTLKRRDCYLDTITRQGTPGVQDAVVASTFCVQPSSSSSVNAAAGLPGAGATVQPIHIYRAGAQCGDGKLDAGEQCDPPMDGACPGTCRLDCRCPGTGCGNGVVDGTEECDGADDGACPGGCQADCTCGGFCGDGVVNGAEECDGADDTACPGRCLGTCVCATCGDGDVNQPTEQCDGSDDSACPQACQPDCTCGPFCGNNQIDPGEECDGTGTGACAGSCQSDCTCAARCGDGVAEAGELCDPGNPPATPADDALCPGECSAACTCPSQGEVTFSVRPGADLDAGWTGVADNFPLQTGSIIRGEISGCDGQTDDDCAFFGNIGSFCSGDPSRSCTNDNQCSGAGTCMISTFGPPLPLSAGGVPACVSIRFATDATGSFNLQSGAAELHLTFNAAVFLGIDVSQPCPICDCGKADPHDCQIGESGTCAGSGVVFGGPCTVEGTGPLGPTSNSCPPSSSLNVTGDGLVLTPDPLTTGTVTFPSSQPCDGSGFENASCWCDGQTQPSACNAACDGGSRDGQACSSDADCPGAPAGACKQLCRQIPGDAVGEAECTAGPVDQTCAGAPEITCTNDGGCPSGKGPCASHKRRCFLDPIVRQGVASTTVNSFAGAFCVAATSGSAINTTAGLPGPGAITFATDVSIKRCGDGIVNRAQEECDGADDGNCPGACLLNCQCNSQCGNGAVEFGEQCDGASDAACPGLCVPAGQPNECTCPPVCGDGFVGPAEQCDPGGMNGAPASDAACPGQCGVVAACQCPVVLPACGNQVLDPGEACDLPATGCGPLQVCLPGCTSCFPPPDIVPPGVTGVCGDLNITPGEVCELPAQSCPPGTLCLNCTQCVPALPVCGNLNIEPGEACELPALGCGPLQACLLCQQCVDVPVAVCGNRNIEPGEACELPQIGCGLLQTCLACQQCVP